MPMPMPIVWDGSKEQTKMGVPEEILYYTLCRDRRELNWISRGLDFKGMGWDGKAG